MNNFFFYNPTKLFFGKGELSRLGEEVNKFGKRVLLVYGGGSIKKNGIYDQVIEKLAAIDAQVFELPGVEPNPRLSTVHKGVAICKEEAVDFILAVGGGSVIDTAKAVAVGAKYDGDVWDIVTKKVRATSALPLGTVLTHAATGSEMNPSSVITNWQLKEKVGWSSTLVFPKFSILDPTYTLTVPKEQTVYGIVDMMTHVLEAYFHTAKNTPLQDRICESILLTIVETAPKLIENLDDFESRETIMYCGTMAINGITQMGLKGDWASHSIEHVLSAIYDIPHGGGLAIIYPHWLRYAAEQNPMKHVQLARQVFGVDPTGKSDQEIAQEGIERLVEFWKSLGAPTRLADYDIDDSKFEEIAEMATAYGELGRYVKLKKEDVINILKASK